VAEKGYFLSYKFILAFLIICAKHKNSLTLGKITKKLQESAQRTVSSNPHALHPHFLAPPPHRQSNTKTPPPKGTE